MFIAPCLQWSSFVPLRRDARAPQARSARRPAARAIIPCSCCCNLF